MFSLIKFHNDKFSVVYSKNVQKLVKDTCVVKCNGGKYSAFIISQNDDKPYLLEVKRKMEEQLSSASSTNENTKSVHASSSCYTVSPSTSNQLSNLNKNANFLTQQKNFNAENHLNPKSSINISGHPILALEHSEKGSYFQSQNIDSSKQLQISNIELDSNFKENKSNADTPSFNVTEKLQNQFKSGQFRQPIVCINERTKCVNNRKIIPEIRFPQSENQILNPSANESFDNSGCTDSTDTDNLPTVFNNNSKNLSECSKTLDSFNQLSSTCVNESSISEYIPDSTLQSSIDNLVNSSSLIEQTTNAEKDDPLNVENVVVPYSKTKSKKHFCIFCKKLQCKIGRHLCFKHKNKAEVKKALAFPKRSKERLNILNVLRKQGDFLHNTSKNYNSGVLIVSRQQQSKCKNKVDDYVTCKKCKGFFSKKTIRVHIIKCGCSKKSRSNFIESRKLTRYVHPEANDTLKYKVFPVLRNDEVTRAVRYDELVIKYANKLTEKYSLEHQYDMIRSHIRLLGRFMLELKKLDPEVNELQEIFKPSVFDNCIKALRIVAHWDESLMWFKTPAVATNLGSIIKKCSKKQKAELIKKEREDLKAQLENFVSLWEDEIPTLINKKAIEDQTSQKLIKKVVLPSKDDIKTLYLYLKENINKAMKKLLKKFRMSSWIKLVENTLIFIQIFNRRRAGEIERLTTKNFDNKEVITDNIDKDMLKNVSQESLSFAKQFVRIRLRGKLGRTVSVLLCPMSVKAVELILKYRPEAGITNENKYIFSRQTTSELTKPYYRACPLLKKFSEECGAKIPESLRGTTLRKHIATHTSLLNVEEASVERLANFMGHHKDIHKSIYRMSIPVAEITCVSKLLLAAVGDDEEKGGNIDIEQDENIDIMEGENIEDNIYDREDNIDDLEDSNIINEANSKSEEKSLEESKNSSSSSIKKRRSTSPFGKTKRCRWSKDEMEATYSIFGNLHKLKKLPSQAECLKAIRQSPVLKNRTPLQLKSWIDNQRRYHME